MNRNNTPIITRLANVGLAISGVVALCWLFVTFVLPRFADDNKRGNDLYQQGLFKRASTEYGHMIEKSPGDPSGYLLRGMAEEKAGDYKRAVQYDTEGLAHAKATDTRFCLLYNRGLARRYMSDYVHAVADLNDALVLEPDNGLAYEVRAHCYVELGDYDRAISDYTVAIGQNPHPGTVFERGQAYLRKKEYQKALADLNRSLSDRPGFLGGYQLRAEAYIALKEYDRAVADAETALHLDNSATNRGNLGWYQYLAGKLPDAIANSQAAIQADPNLNVARFNLGLCYAVQGNADAAQTAYQDALQHAKAADIKSAIPDVKSALAKLPNSPALKQAETMLQNALSHASAS